MELLELMKKDAALVSEELARILRTDLCALQGLFDSERYSIEAGGKRIRPFITLLFCRMFGGEAEWAVPYAAALEMIHTASLIHDDLPIIDNDDLRRGSPTNHKVFGEATALLAADGLLMDSFGIVAANPHKDAATNLAAVSYLSRMTGSRGLVGGEYIDVMGENKELSLEDLELMDDLKTGALIRASAVLGALAAGVRLDDERMQDCITYSDSIGRAFQIVDDLLDLRGDVQALGKNPGQDVRAGKTTYLSFYTEEQAEKEAHRLTELAISAVSKYEGSEVAVALARFLVRRES